MLDFVSGNTSKSGDQSSENWSPVAAPPRPGGQFSRIQQFAVLALLLIAATLVKLAFLDFFHEGMPFLLFFAPLVLAAWWFGVAGGFAVVGLSAFLGFQFLRPENAHNFVRVSLFVAESGVLVLLTERARAERRKAISFAQRAHSIQAKLRAILEGSDEGITVQDRRGRLLYANQKAAILVGFASADAFLNTPAAEVLAKFDLLDESGQRLPPESLPGRAVFDGTVPPEKLVRFRIKATGEERWAWVRARPAGGDDSQRPAFAVNVFQDITDQRRHEESLRVSREWFSMALKSVGDAVLATDEHGIITFMNPAAESLTGWQLADAMGLPHRTVFNIVNEATRVTVESPVEVVLREGQVVGLANHTILITKVKDELCIEDSAAPIKDSAGHLVGTVLVFRDVSTQRAKERRRLFIAQSAIQLGSSLDYEKTLATVARLAVPVVADWCAVDLVEPSGLKRLAVAHVDPNKVAFVQELEARYPPDSNAPGGVPNILRTGKSEILAEIPRQMLAASAKDAEHLELIEKLQLCSYIGVPLRVRGTTIGVITLFMAESHRHYTEDDLSTAEVLADRAAAAIENARLYADQISARQRTELAHSKAEAASRSKDEFLAMLGHELRNPLAPILTALQLMSLRGGDTFLRERTVIDRQVRHVVRLVDDLLDVSRITRGKVELDKRPLEMADVVAKALEMASPLIEQKQHTLTVEVPKGLVVHGDAERLVQVVTNLLTNAAKYTDQQGSLMVTAARIDNSVVLHVRDNGMGIAPEMLPRVFEVFTQEAQAIDRAQGGLGLGLAIVKSLVQLHQGTVTATSGGVGCGSEFTITLPALDALSSVTKEVTQPRVLSAGIQAARILIVDDNVDALELMAEALNESGYQTFTATDGPSALALVAKSQPQIALVDIGLPVMDGYEVATRLRENETSKDIKLIALTGYGQATDRERAFGAGFDAHLVKPVSLPTVLETVARFVAKTP